VEYGDSEQFQARARSLRSDFRDLEEGPKE
jgi:hypothetical protein